MNPNDDVAACLRKLTRTPLIQGLGTRSVAIDDEDDDEVIERNLAAQYLASCAPLTPGPAVVRPFGLDGNEAHTRDRKSVV